jgi:hypothetical protein
MLPIRRKLPWIALFALCGCARTIEGSGTITKDERQPGPFSEVELRGNLLVAIHLGAAEHSATLEGDDNVIAAVRSKSDGRRLLIEPEGELAPTRRLALTIAAPDLALVRSSGSVDLKLYDVHNARLQIDLTGSGSAKAHGSTQKLKVFVNGSGEVQLEQLDIKEALVHVDGPGSVDIASPEHLEVEIHGSGRVSHAGTPTIEKTLRDQGTLRRR